MQNQQPLSLFFVRLAGTAMGLTGSRAGRAIIGEGADSGNWDTIASEGHSVSAHPKTNWFTLEEYFAVERASERRFEYRDGEIVCMSGGSRADAAIARNVLHYLTSRLAKTCEAYGSDLALFVPDGKPYRYPDASVVCGNAQFREINGLDALENPNLIVEVLAPSISDFDRGTKFEEYKSIPEFAEYLLVSQDRIHVTRRTRNTDGSWNEKTFESPTGTIRLESVGIDLAIAEVYEGLAL